MQTNNIGCHNYESQNTANDTSEIPSRLIKKHTNQEGITRRESIEKAVEAILDQISTSMSKKCSEKENLTSADNQTTSALDTSTSINNQSSTLKTSATNSASSPLDKMLSPDSSGNVNEEQLQSAIVQSLLEGKDKNLGKAYLQELSNSIAQGNQFEDSVKLALKALVKQGAITKEEAEKINGDSFRAAQLDNNLTALYDSKGGKGDDTIAVMKLEDAVKAAKQALEDIKSGKLTASIRSLDAPSNKKMSSSSGAKGSSGSSAGFLWKPVSDSNGKLAVLFPPNLTGSIQSAGIYSKLPASHENIIEEGKYSGDGNGNRSHFRFSKQGGSYADGVFVVAQLKDGSQATFQIGDSASRNT